ncbi:MAG: chaplin [Catenulispora sp.]|nr:chaplin [Catenulispora sp.]
MHAYIKRGLLLSAATGAAVLGGAAAASAATSATVDGATAGSPGAVSGNTVQVPADVPVQICGDTAAAAAAVDGAYGNECQITGTTAHATGFAAHSPGAVSGNVGSVAADVPVQVCGVDAAAIAAGIKADGNSCREFASSATAVGEATGSPGLISGNVLQLALNAPVQACGDSLGLIAYGDKADGNSCVSGEPEHPHPGPPPWMPPPPMTPPPWDCPPPGHHW